MSALRRRPLPVVNGSAKKPDLAQRDANKSLKDSATSCYSYVRQIILLASLAFSVLLLYYPTSPESLSTSYALCSRDGLHIHTVDDANARVQCLVVHKASIFDTGSLGTSFLTQSSPTLNDHVLTRGCSAPVAQLSFPCAGLNRLR